MAKPTSRNVPVKFQDSKESSLKLDVDKRVTERVDGTVEVTQPVGEAVEVHVDGHIQCHHQDKHVVRSPAHDKGAQDEGDRPQSLSGAVLRLGLPLPPVSPLAVLRTKRFDQSLESLFLMHLSYQMNAPLVQIDRVA